VALDLDSDRSFQERWWKVERIGWSVMFLVILAALTGLTGRGGPFATAEVRAGAAEITYPRVARWQTAAELSVRFPAATGEKGTILLPSDFVSSFSVESVSPQPSKVVASADGMLYEFDLEAGAGSKSAEFALRAVHPSFWRTVHSTADEAPERMSFIILP
jgi:hypothetical protein